VLPRCRRHPSHSGGDGSRRLLQANASSGISILSNSQQKFSVADANYQGGKAIIHIIDGVLVPKSLVEQFNLTSVPGASAANVMPTETPKEPAAAAGDARGSAATAATAAPAASPRPRSSAGAAAATLLAVPTLLAVLML
jgi:hypothetical protein